MSILRPWLSLLLMAVCAAPVAAQEPRDWADTARYRAANAQLGPPAAGRPRVVLMGDSITDAWPGVAPALFADRGWVGRGISGQTTPQMLVRFRADVIELKPAAVVILAGTNDIAGNTGPTSTALIVANIASMAELARAHGIRVVIASVLPVSRYPWSPAIEPAGRVIELNTVLRDLARREGHAWVDYHAAMADAQGGLPAKYADDGVHPNAAGYAVMQSLLVPVLDEVLGTR